MCDNCEPYIDICFEDECGSPQKGGKYTSATKFYAGDEYCRHLQAEHGHRYAEWGDI